MYTKQIEIKCKFCGNPTGSIQINDIKRTLEEDVSVLDTSIMEINTRLSYLGNTDNQIEHGMSEEEVSQEVSKLNGELTLTQEKKAELSTELDSVPQQDPSMEELGIADSRCGECEDTHGKFTSEENQA